MSGHQQASNTDARSDINGLISALADLGIASTGSLNPNSFAESKLANIEVGRMNSVYHAMSQVIDTSLQSIESAISIDEAMIPVSEDQLDLDKADPQLNVIGDLMAARKCWVILQEMKRTLMTGEEWKSSVGRDDWKV